MAAGRTTKTSSTRWTRSIRKLCFEKKCRKERTAYGSLLSTWQKHRQTLYAHCCQVCVTQGQQVQAGQVIAYVGHTGRATGNHLHFEVRENGERVDAMRFYS